METSLYRPVDTGMMLPVWQKDTPRCRDCLPLTPFPLPQALTLSFLVPSQKQIHIAQTFYQKKEKTMQRNPCFMLRDRQKAKASTRVAETESKLKSSTHEVEKRGFRKCAQDFSSCSKGRASLSSLSLS